MVVGLSNTLNTARVGMLANMTEIDIIGHNIANANNPDYRRQVGYLETTNPIPSNLGPRGTGVQVSRVESLYDRFLFRQVSHEKSNQGRWETLAGGLDSVERVFNDLEGHGLAQQMAEFWGAWEDLANQPGGGVERESLVGKSRVLSSTLNSMGEDLNFQRQVLNRYFDKGVSDINQMADSLGEMNLAILESEINGGQNNDLRDRRLALLSDLSEMVDIDYNEDNTGQLNIMLQGGKPLVLGSEVYHLKSLADDQGDFHAYFGSEGIPIDDLLGNGKMKGWIDARDGLIRAQDDLNRMASSLIFNVNQAHFQGYNLDGETSSTFFDHRIELAVGQDNEGEASISFDADSTSAEAPEGIAWETLANYDDFEIRFTADHVDGSGTKDFVIVNTTTGVELDASSYAIDDTAVDGEFVISFNDTTDTALTPDKGYHIKLSFSSGEEPKKNDTFKLSFGMHATRTVEVNSNLENPDKVAISDNYFEVPGNNKIALQIAQLQHQQVVNGQQTYSEFYTSLVSRVGSASYTAQSRQGQSKMVLDQLNIREESVSGVSIDEEMVNLIKFQQSYQATARMITTVDELMQILNDML
ncbi:MAG: flagellar hook-associated protein FlgK [Deltaproteobacteria bacterium]|nr:MAG: flagellar hook-associated protein FlgK [Deltaproteobacteria bacterium]